ncbi:hypothetical protein P3G55_09905 [Leptospira sp. 96542]|nr:hypothetical protein [Leptospira sp. 96542]
MDYKSIRFIIILLFIAGVLSAKPKRELKILIDSEADASFELELWQEKPKDEEAVSKNTPEVLIIKGNRITVTPKDEFDYFRIRRIGEYGAKGYWTQVFSTSVDPDSPLSVPKEFVKPKLVAVEKPKPTVVSGEQFIVVKGKEEIKYLTKKSLLLSPSDDGAGISEVRYKINDGDWNTSKSATEIQFSEEGNYKLLYFAMDLAGNKEPSKLIYFTKDTTPPQTLLEWMGSGYGGKSMPKFLSPDTKIKLNAKDNLSGVKQTFYAYACADGTTSEFVLSDKEHSISELKTICKGSFRFLYYSVDQVGNEEPVQSINLFFGQN